MLEKGTCEKALSRLTASPLRRSRARDKTKARRLRTKSFRLSKTSSRKHDGVGQQALGAISCMVLARLEPAAYCYVNDPARPYAGNTYPCQLGDSWWWSPGFGRDDCPEGGFFRRPARGDGGDGVR